MSRTWRRPGHGLENVQSPRPAEGAWANAPAWSRAHGGIFNSPGHEGVHLLAILGDARFPQSASFPDRSRLERQAAAYRFELEMEQVANPSSSVDMSKNASTPADMPCFLRPRLIRLLRTPHRPPARQVCAPTHIRFFVHVLSCTPKQGCGNIGCIRFHRQTLLASTMPLEQTRHA